MSPEARKLAALHVPRKTRPGDMWHCVRLGLVSLTLGYGHGRRRPGLTYVFMYHWGEPSLRAKPCDLADYDPAAGASWDPATETREKWAYVGNVFEILPYPALTGHPQYLAPWKK